MATELSSLRESSPTDNNLSLDQYPKLEELEAYIVDLIRKDEQKKNERALNNHEKIGMNSLQLAKLDSNIKKSTAFVRKLKNLNEPMKESLFKEINSLNFSKYLSEITAALVELKLKSSELPIYIEICTELHRKYPEFNGQLLEQWQGCLPKSLAEVTNYSKLRTDLPLFAELIVCGIFVLKEALPVLGNLLRLLLSEKDSINLNVVLNFCRLCGWDYAGLVSRKMRIAAEKHGKVIPQSSFLTAERQKGLRTLLGDYFRQLVRKLEQDHLDLRNKEKQNKQILMTKGEIFAKRKEQYETARLNFNKFLQSVQQFADLLDEEMPKFDSDVPELDEISMECFQESKVNINEMPLWEDESIRLFYEQLPNLKISVPAHLYKESIKEKYRKSVKKPASIISEKSERSDRRDRDDPYNCLTDEMLAEKLSKELINGESDDETNTIEKVLDKFQLDSDDEKKDDKKIKFNGKNSKEEPDKTSMTTFLASLLNCMNRDMIDKAALDFANHLNTKSNRKKLIRALFSCPRTRLDLLPFYARFAATVNPIMPLIGAELVYLLKKDFRFHLKKKDQMNIESKVKNVRFIGELTKFGVFPKDETLQCLKILLLDFAHHHIEMACKLFEVCGRFLYLSPESHHKCNLLLKQMMRKKTLITLQPKYISMIENAFYASCPSASNQLVGNSNTSDSSIYQTDQMPQFTNPQLFCIHLIQNELNKSSIDRVLRLLLLYPYSDKVIFNHIVRCFTEIWNVKYYNIQVVAHCLAALDLHQPAVTTSVVDAVLEDVRLMIEINSIKHNQRRIAVLKYLGELYNYKLIESVVIINTLYLLITFEVNSNYEGFFNIWINKCNQMNTKSENNEAERSLSITKDEDLDSKLLEYGESELDEADNLFRIRLVCVLLDTAGLYITSTSGKKRLQCFLLFFQLYFQRKKSLPLYNENLFPVESEFLFVDTIKRLKPKFKFAENYGEAYIAVHDMLSDLAPSVTKLFPKLQSDNKKVLLKRDLHVITENDDEDEDDEEEEEDEERLAKREKDDEMDLTMGLDNGKLSPLNVEEEEAFDEEYPDDDYDINEEDDEGNQNKLNSPLIPDEEDDEFQREFDRMITESLVNRDIENIRNINSDIVIPISKVVSLTKPSFKINQVHGPNNCLLEPEPESKFNVVLMTKSKNKPLLRRIEVPSDCRLAIDLREKERAEREEKEMVKKLTLDINERREMEDEMLERNNLSGTISLNLNRDSRRKYNHLKGVPDAELIFGSGKSRKS